jgi:hypothetical protein
LFTSVPRRSRAYKALAEFLFDILLGFDLPNGVAYDVAISGSSGISIHQAGIVPVRTLLDGGSFQSRRDQR